MRNLFSYEHWLEESSGDIYKPKRGRIIEFDPTEHPELANEFFDLIQVAYAEIGGHTKVKSPNDVFADPEWNFWQGIDIHGTEDFDVILFGKKTKYGIKFAGVGHDGTKDAKRKFVETRAKDLKTLGYFIEVSGKLAAILIDKYGVPSVDDQKEVEKILEKPVDWRGKPQDPNNTSGNSWYGRKIGGHDHEKIMLGRPKI